MYCTLLKEINTLLDTSKKDVIIVAIDGPCASGKSSLANFLNDNFICNIFHMDDFFLPPEKKTAQRLAQPGGNVDYERFEEEILKNINKKQNFRFNIYDCKNLSLFESGKVFHKRLNIVEGVYSMHPELNSYYDYRVFLDVTEDKKHSRILNRSNEKKLQRFKDEWIPMENSYFDTYKVKENCDLVIDTTDMF